MHIIGRLCIRQLRNYQKDVAEVNLFEYLCEDSSIKLYKKFSDSLRE